ncbi:antitoxin VbhA family protein [Aquipseudomonas alcaligenes]|uniref:Antitoxin VbhA family protein n=1 Tax=Aquipseudomonas alcaligenes TaxID=43263 RepID=A0AB73I839_AQUAC|nr:antitoxin VbhA family protein [Pseudomonas alcaligenes]MDH0144698.1 antitoxin VbhA family protein [Pseudomonas alcaligenes]
MSKITSEERAKRVEVVRYARAANALEGLKSSPFARELQVRWIDGEITIDEAIEAAVARYRQQ